MDEFFDAVKFTGVNIFVAEALYVAACVAFDIASIAKGE